MKPYSKDLRIRVLAAVDRGSPRREIADTFGVSEPTIRRWLRLRRETGGVDARPPSGPPAHKGRALEETLPAQVSRNPDLTLEEHRELFEDEHGRAVSVSSLSRAFGRLGLPLKKVPPGLRARRSRKGALARRGKASGSRVPGVLGRMRDSHVHDAASGQSAQGRAGLRQGSQEPRQEHDALGEHGGRGDGAVHGGGGFHDQGGLRDLRRAGARAVFEAGPGGRHGQPRRPQGRAGPGPRGGARLLVGLPAAILAGLLSHPGGLQQALKALLRKAKARTRVTLLEAIGRAISAITARDAAGYFGHCGYPLDAQPS